MEQTKESMERVELKGIKMGAGCQGVELFTLRILPHISDFEISLGLLQLSSGIYDRREY